LGDTPYPEQGFDLNLSEIEDGFIVEIGSERGKEFIEKENQLFSAADSTRIEQRRLIREKVGKQMEGKRIEVSREEMAFEEVSDEIGKCVSCAACTNVCPSCFCFLLGEGSGLDKVRSWDSCQYPGYARVAGGANPRKEVTSRFAHRVECKFVYSPERFGSRGCFGCGRCIDACLGGIDFKDVLMRLSSAQFGVGSSEFVDRNPRTTNHKLRVVNNG
jgi:ferredoxin